MSNHLVNKALLRPIEPGVALADASQWPQSQREWKYAIQAASEVMTARPAGEAVGNAGLCR
jgi:hypothetical protein